MNHEPLIRPGTQRLILLLPILLITLTIYGAGYILTTYSGPTVGPQTVDCFTFARHWCVGDNARWEYRALQNAAQMTDQIDN